MTKRLLLLLLFFFPLVVYSTETVSLRDKIGQMLIIGFDEATVNKASPIVSSIIDDNIGGVILYDFNYNTSRFERNIQTPAQVRELNRKLQAFATLGNRLHHRPRLPLIISVDYEGGHGSRLREKQGFPKTLSPKHFGALSLPKAQETAEEMALTLKSHGFNLNYSPNMDVNTNPNNPVIAQRERSYSSDPDKVLLFSILFSKAMQAQNIISVCKHFPGHGSSDKDSHLGFVDVTKTWHPKELKPFKEGIIKQGTCPVIMAAHIVNHQLDPKGLPGSLSQPMLTKLLRDNLGFKGVIMTDDMQMKAISAHFSLEDSIVMAINAGSDMLIFANHHKAQALSPKTFIDIVLKNLKAGKIKQERIDEAYNRIKALKRSI